MSKPALNIVLAGPRGFCAGVERAIEIVRLAIEKFGPPVYVRHEIVHNRYVVESLEKLGAIFVDELDEVPEGGRVIFSAHGVPKSVPVEADKRHLDYIDATCPLVSKVHIEAERHFRKGRHVLLIGHAGHPEVVGTLGQLPSDAITLIENAEQAAKVTPPVAADQLAYITQTTLSVDDAAAVVAVLKKRFPAISEPHKEDICYATTNRQAAIKSLAPSCDAVLVVGSPNSSNSVRLVEVAHKAGCDNAMLVQSADELDLDRLQGAKTIAITAGASAPEVLVQGVVESLRQNFDVTVSEQIAITESVSFKLPRQLRL